MNLRRSEISAAGFRAQSASRDFGVTLAKSARGGADFAAQLREQNTRVDRTPPRVGSRESPHTHDSEPSEGLSNETIQEAEEAVGIDESAENDETNGLTGEDSEGNELEAPGTDIRVMNGLDNQVRSNTPDGEAAAAQANASHESAGDCVNSGFSSAVVAESGNFNVDSSSQHARESVAQAAGSIQIPTTLAATRVSAESTSHKDEASAKAAVASQAPLDIHAKGIEESVTASEASAAVSRSPGAQSDSQAELVENSGASEREGASELNPEAPHGPSARRLSNNIDAISNDAIEICTSSERLLSALTTRAVAKMRPVSISALSQLKLEGQEVGRFALVNPEFHPGKPADSEHITKGSQSGADANIVGQAVSALDPGNPQSSERTAHVAGWSSTVQAQGTATNSNASIPQVGLSSAAATPTTVRAAVDNPVASKQTSQRELNGAGSVESGTRMGISQPSQSGQSGSNSREERREQHSRQALDALVGLSGGGTRMGVSAKSPVTLSPATQLQRTISSQVHKGVTQALNAPGGAITLRLSPEHLGQVRIQVHLKDGGVKASFEVGSGRARELVEKSLASLRTSLVDKGLRVEGLQVALARPLPMPEAYTTAFDPGALGHGWNGSSNGNGSSPQEFSSSWSGSASDGSPRESEIVGVSTAAEPAMRYMTMPDGRLGLTALA
jgi:flagellar hook-length control protein FliK